MTKASVFYSDLPNKPSELIALAVEDMKKSIEAGIKIDMGDWMETEVDGAYIGEEYNTRNVVVCSVCMAGAVMLQSLNTVKEDVFDPNEYGTASGNIKNEKKLYFLNVVRKLDDLKGQFAYDSVIRNKSDNENITRNEYDDIIRNKTPDESYNRFDHVFLSIVRNVFGLTKNEADKLNDHLSKFLPIVPYKTSPKWFFRTINWLIEDFKLIGL